ncbi:GntR family transcriptional regulator [Microbacterium aureliae]
MTLTLYRYTGPSARVGPGVYTYRAMVAPEDFTPLIPREGKALGDDVYAILGEAIIRGTLRPGDRLRDVELATRLGVSRTPVREALQRLERVGLVEVAANRYTRVSELHPRANEDTMEFITFVAGDAALLALPRCTDEQLVDLVAGVDALIEGSARDDALAILGATVAFYQLLIRATGNLVFVTIMREAGLALQRNLQAWAPPVEPTEVRTERYRTLRQAVSDRDGPAVELLLRDINHVVVPS